MTDAKSGKVVRVEEEMVPFESEDASGARASISLATKKVDVKGVEHEDGASEAVLAMVRRQWPDATVIGARRFAEEVLAVGQLVFVVGPARAVGQGDEYRGSRRLVVGAAADPTVRIAVQARSARQVLEQTTRLAWTLTAVAVACLLVIAAVILGHA